MPEILRAKPKAAFSSTHAKSIHTETCFVCRQVAAVTISVCALDVFAKSSLHVCITICSEAPLSSSSPLF